MLTAVLARQTAAAVGVGTCWPWLGSVAIGLPMKNLEGLLVRSFPGRLTFLSPANNIKASSSCCPLFHQPSVDDEFVTRCFHVLPSLAVSVCCSNSKSKICNVIFDVICPALRPSSDIPSPFYVAVHCSWWQSYLVFVHSCNMAKPIQPLLIYFVD